MGSQAYNYQDNILIGNHYESSNSNQKQCEHFPLCI
jgi:hypothetical protein